MYLGNINGLYLLLFGVLLIILYLIKAKPKEITIPSLLFFSEGKKVDKYNNSILRKLLIRAILLLQLLFIILIALSAANPFVNIPMDAYSLNSVVIVDMSASMNTRDGTINRMDASKPELLKLVKGRTSIILAEDSPVVVATNISASRAKAIITNLEPKDLPTRIDSSILLASDILGEEKGNILVYSDFVLNKEDDLLAAKKIAEANDKRVILIQTGEKQPNLGFITLSLSRGKGEAVVKNFGKRSEVVDIRLKDGGSNKEPMRVEIAPYSVENINFEVTKGESTLELSRKDWMTVDDQVYIMNPYEDKVKVLFITNNKKGSPLLDALQSNSLLDVEVTMPPVVPDLKYDLVVISQIDTNLLLPNTFRDIAKYRDTGGKVIIVSQDNINSFNFQGLIDFEIGNLNQAGDEICVGIVNEFTSKISNPKCFTSVSKYYEINNIDESSVVIAMTKSGRPTFIIEEGLFYYGIIDSYSGFSEQINYPLFWNDLINFMLGRENLANFNFKTGDIFLSGVNNSNRYFFDEGGFVSIDGRKVAVNLLNSYESDIYRDSVVTGRAEFDTDYEQVNLDVNIDQLLILLGVIVLGFELYYIKRRGDL